MNIELMRCIDYWVGIPLCFLFTGMNYISKLFMFRRKRTAFVKKILFIKLSEMGSIILAYPLIMKVRTEYPEAEISFLTFKKNKPIFEILNIVPQYNILTIREGSIRLFILDTLRVIKKIRRERIDIVFDLELFSRFTAFLTYLSGIPKKVGFYRYTMEGLYRGNFLTHKIQYNPLLHISKIYLSLWQSIKIERKSTPDLEEKIENREIFLPKFIPSIEAKRQMYDKLKDFGIKQGKKLLLFNLGEGNIPLREWPLENYIIVAKKLLEEDSYIFIVGMQGVANKARLFFKSLNNDRCIDLSNKTTLPELLTLFTLAEILLTSDSGLAHLASLASIKNFVLFGPESPQIYAPLGENTWIIYSHFPCSPCLSAFNHRKSACKDNRCLKVITPDEVYKIIKKNI